MKKLLAMLLACVSVAAFAGCGGTGDSTGNNGGSNADTQVTADEFAAAFDFGTNYSCIATITYEGKGIEYWGWYRAGDLFKSTVEAKNLDGTAIEGEHLTENFVEKDGENIYYYTPSYSEGVLQYFNKETRDESFEDLESEELEILFAAPLQIFASYTYNAETQAYEAAEIAIGDSQAAKDVSFKFVDNKLVSGSYTMTMTYGSETMSLPVTVTMTYGGVTVTLPTNLAPVA